MMRDKKYLNKTSRKIINCQIKNRSKNIDRDLLNNKINN